jgi:hypothetical protein
MTENKEENRRRFLMRLIASTSIKVGYEEHPDKQPCKCRIVCPFTFFEQGHALMSMDILQVVQPETPLDNIDTFVDAMEEYGCY